MCPTPLSSTVLVTTGDTFSLTGGAATGFWEFVARFWEAEEVGTALTAPVDPLASATMDAEDGHETLVADTGRALIAEVIGMTGIGGGGMAHGASVGRHSMNKQRLDASQQRCSRMTIGRYTASKVTSCHIEV